MRLQLTSGVRHKRIGRALEHLLAEVVPNVKDEPRLWLARLLRSRRRDRHGRWLWRLVRRLVCGSRTGPHVRALKAFDGNKGRAWKVFLF